ncbi:hypothetical protein LEP1GSC050_0773 [Leptospira broomii serovar Hurstbridge str. 5399]|uniref:Uncharacterized protein n=1 Tax=Leptospira broomii serovar Hurstbridge str. 5399 TaxID=1049789 RepID=T0FGD4_9LEPT|nr:hypothetical protein LEP1GSC050_0773 [Leptospira broomii serovar Hurstbridge str. 5399]
MGGGGGLVGEASFPYIILSRFCQTTYKYFICMSSHKFEQA